ncbi:aromatic acid exporter family protein [Mycobacterium simiae]|uniref:Aromatic acid exporter family protein n=1 Tax=Mycobacterium simiae TaxID=1784 RepID=A0A5B1BAN3_MYCSI|nr:FUSC family protein [Mycobacterium simiae]KAA1245687.1 aromatic acid exporter family protein [Mycobacterium simiae]
MNSSLLTRVSQGSRAAVQRLRAALWPITQTSVAAGIAWFLTHDVLHHRQPFFAPISAVVCMSATNVLRGLRAAQMIVGVALGIVLGASVHPVLGAGPSAMAVAVFIALSIAVLSAFGLIAQGLMFVNQTAVSAVLVLVFAPTGEGVVGERLFDALVGGGLALVFAILLFPANPVDMLCTSRAAVLAAVHETLCQVAEVLSGPGSIPADWPRAAVDRMHRELDGLIQVRATAHLVTRIAPRRWAMKDTIGDVDEQATRLGLLVSSVMHLARTVTGPDKAADPQPVLAVLSDLAAGTMAADRDPAAATEHITAARGGASELLTAATDRNAVVLADVVLACVDDLQQVVEFPSSLQSGAR